MATDLSGIRSIKKNQQYWAVGQTVHTHFHITPVDGAYAWIAYYSRGRFDNTVTATAKSTATFPQAIVYNNRAELRFKHISIGWKHYLKGRSNAEKRLNIYGMAGFGLLLGSVTNIHSANIDTANYMVPVSSGKSHFKRLTLDVGLGIEAPVGGDIYMYFEGRSYIPTTDYPSRYLLVNENAPFTVNASLGIRILLY
ncbi:MAG: hypothetical protein H7Y42_03420 [Chitinophagaceae bacterium]|nr:hypothetical protein [Chitinophagaceae bacterium]